MNPWRSLAGLPRPLYLAAFATFVNRAGTMVVPFLALYLSRERGLGDEGAGRVLMLFGAAALVTAPFAGRLCDRLGAARMMVLSLLAGAGAFALYPFTSSLPALCAATVLVSATSEAFRPASLAFITDIATAEQRKPAFALQRLAVNLGVSIGPVAGGFLVERSFGAIFAVDAVTSLAAAIVLALALRGHRPAERPPLDPSAPPARQAHRDPRLLRMLAAMLFVGIVFMQLDSSMPLYLVEHLGLRPSTYGLLFTVNTGIIIFVEVPLNAAMSSWAPRRALLLGTLLTAVGFAATGLARGMPTLVATVVVWTFGEMILFPSASAYVADLAPERRSGEYMGLFTMTFGLAATIAPWLGTTVLHRLGGPALWAGALAAGLVALAILAPGGKRGGHEV